MSLIVLLKLAWVELSHPYRILRCPVFNCLRFSTFQPSSVTAQCHSKTPVWDSDGHVTVKGSESTNPKHEKHAMATFSWHYFLSGLFLLFSRRQHFQFRNHPPTMGLLRQMLVSHLQNPNTNMQAIQHRGDKYWKQKGQWQDVTHIYLHGCFNCSLVTQRSTKVNNKAGHLSKDCISYWK